MTALSVLDQSPVADNSSPAQALRDTGLLAREAERLGYKRYWLAEHHNTASLAGTAPEVVACYIAAQTSSIRVGAGGILLSHYSALKVAETFRTLDALFPGRIDLALGRTPGADPVAIEALQLGPGVLGDEHYPDRVADVVGFVHDSLRADHRLASVRAMPHGPGAPAVWILGSSSYGSALAARMGLPFCFAHFISPKFGPQVVAAYRRQFRPSPWHSAPVASVAVSVVCAETDGEAERLARSGDVWHVHPDDAERRPLLSAEEAEAYQLSAIAVELMAQQRDRRTVGAPARVRSDLLGLANTYGVDELVVRTITHDADCRLRSYQLLADAFGLTG